MSMRYVKQHQTSYNHSFPNLQEINGNNASSVQILEKPLTEAEVML